MPARVSIELDEAVLAQIIAELELSDPPTFTLNGSSTTQKFDGAKVRGYYSPADNHVSISTQGESYEKEGLVVLTKHIRFTVLHELRHAWQREHWTDEQKALGSIGPYNLRPEELDANAWADYASPKYRGIVRVKKTQVGKSGFSRLSDATRRYEA